MKINLVVNRFTLLIARFLKLVSNIELISSLIQRFILFQYDFLRICYEIFEIQRDLIYYNQNFVQDKNDRYQTANNFVNTLFRNISK